MERAAMGEFADVDFSKYDIAEKEKKIQSYQYRKKKLEEEKLALELKLTAEKKL
jgi:hypothetical protein